MKASHLANKFLPIGLLAVLLLPYTAPGVCGLLGRIAGGMEMSNDVVTAAVQPPASGAMCCSVEACGIPQVAPPGCNVILMAEIIDVRAQLPAPLSADPTIPRFLTTPPPQV